MGGVQRLDVGGALVGEQGLPSTTNVLRYSLYSGESHGVHLKCDGRACSGSRHTPKSLAS